MRTISDFDFRNRIRFNPQSYNVGFAEKPPKSYFVFEKSIIRRIFSHVFGEDVTRRLWNNPKRSRSSIEDNILSERFVHPETCLFIYFLRVHNVILTIIRN